MQLNSWLKIWPPNSINIIITQITLTIHIKNEASQWIIKLDSKSIGNTLKDILCFWGGVQLCVIMYIYTLDLHIMSAP